MTDGAFDPVVDLVLQLGFGAEAGAELLQARGRPDPQLRVGVVGPSEGSKAREVLMTVEEFELLRDAGER